MALKPVEYEVRRTGQGYLIEVPGVKRFIASKSSQDYLLYPDAVRFADCAGGPLVSFGEGIAVRLKEVDDGRADLPYATRTFGLFGYFDGMPGALFDDPAGAKENIVLARADENYASYRKNGKWVLPKSDSYVKGSIERAVELHGQVSASPRFMALPAQNRLELALEKADGRRSAFGRMIQPIAGNDKIAEGYAGWLRAPPRSYRVGVLYTLTPNDLKSLGVDNDTVEVWPVVLGGGVFISSVDANSRFNDGGVARAVVHGAREISTGNKGRRKVRSR